MRRAAERLPRSAQGGADEGRHLAGDTIVDLLFQRPVSIARGPPHQSAIPMAPAARSPRPIAAGLAQKMTLLDAVTRARTYVRQAITSAPGFGRGHGPLNHAVTVK